MEFFIGLAFVCNCTFSVHFNCRTNHEFLGLWRIHCNISKFRSRSSARSTLVSNVRCSNFYFCAKQTVYCFDGQYVIGSFECIYNFIFILVVNNYFKKNCRFIYRTYQRKLYCNFRKCLCWRNDFYVFG